MFHFYFDDRGDGRNEFTLRKSHVTLERLAMIFNPLFHNVEKWPNIL